MSTPSPTLIPTSPTSRLYRDAENKFFDPSAWTDTGPRPTIVNVLYVNHQRQQQWYDYDSYSKRVGNEQYMYIGAARECNLGDDNTRLNACQLTDCALCSFLRGSLDILKTSTPLSPLGIGAYASPSSSGIALLRQRTEAAKPRPQQNIVLLRCSVAVGKTLFTTARMRGRTAPPAGYDSISGASVTQGGVLPYPQTVVFTRDAILPVEVIVLRFPNPSAPDPYVTFTRRLTNVSTADWSKYPEAIRDTYYGETLWTDGIPSYFFASAPNIRAYKVVRRNPPTSPSGQVVADGYAAANDFYFKLE